MSGQRRGSRPDSVAGRLLAFFLANPDEELTFDMAVTKFDGSKHNISGAIARSDMLESVTVIRLKAKGRA